MCQSTAQLSAVIPLAGTSEGYYRPQLHCTLPHNLAGAEVLLALSWCGPLLVSDVVLNFYSCTRRTKKRHPPFD
jgi:hypothetical protein